MKKLNLQHVFKAAKIIKKANLKETLAGMITEANKPEADKTKVGVDIAFCLVDACAEEGVETQLYDLLDDVFETKTSDMSLDAIIDNFKELAKENNLSNFFKSAEALTK